MRDLSLWTCGTYLISSTDETPVAMLDPGAGKTHRAYLWSYCTPNLQDERLVLFDFAESRAGRHSMEFLGHPGERAWRGTLVCDDYSGYKALFAQGVTEVGCLAHARRKFHELWVNHKSSLAEQALVLFGRLYDVEREVADLPRRTPAHPPGQGETGGGRAAFVGGQLDGFLGLLWGATVNQLALYKLLIVPKRRYLRSRKSLLLDATESGSGSGGLATSESKCG